MSTNSLFVCYPSENFENVSSEKKKAVVKNKLTSKSTSKSSKKVSSKPHSSHIKYTAQDIFDVTKWQQEKWPNNSTETNNKWAIYLLKTSPHSLDYLKGNASARAVWAKVSAKNKKTSKPSKKVSKPNKKTLKPNKKVSKPSKKVSKVTKEKFENDVTTPPVTEPPTYTKSTYIPLFNMSYHTDDNKNKQLCIGNTCVTKDNIASLFTSKLGLL